MASPVPFCVHCLVAPGTTEDHGVPASWYPDTSAPDLERITAPSCRACNLRLARVEEEIRQVLGLCLDPRDPRAAGIPERAARAMTPERGRDEKDRARREAVRARILADAFVPASAFGQLPGFGPQNGSVIAVKIRSKALREFGEKLMRVATWTASHRYIDAETVAETHILSDRHEALAAQIARTGRVFEVPPAVRVAIARVSDDERASMLVADLWGRLRLFVTTLPKTVDAELRSSQALIMRRS